VPDGIPHDALVDAKILVYYDVPHVAHIAPRNLSVCDDNLIGHTRGGLADSHDVVQHSINGLSITANVS